MILPELYYNCLKDYLSESQLLTLEILVWLLQVHKQVRLERLAACFPLPLCMKVVADICKDFCFSRP